MNAHKGSPTSAEFEGTLNLVAQAERLRARQTARLFAAAGRAIGQALSGFVERRIQSVTPVSKCRARTALF